MLQLNRKTATAFILGTLLSNVDAFSPIHTQPSSLNSARAGIKLAVKSPLVPSSSKFSYLSSEVNDVIVRSRSNTVALRQSSSPDNEETTAASTDPIFSGATTLALVGGQSLLVVGAVIAAKILNVPNYGLGSEFDLNLGSVQYGLLATLPLFGLAFVLDFVEKSVPALQDVTKATQRSVLTLMGGKRKPLIALGISIALGAAAGWGEEMLFRGVLQSELTTRFGDVIALTSSAVVFGALHAVTPLYAALATLASLYFGELYIMSENLAVPIVCHGIYDVGALLWAHYVVTEMSDDERMDILNWVGPMEGPPAES